MRGITLLKYLKVKLANMPVEQRFVLIEALMVLENYKETGSLLLSELETLLDNNSKLIQFLIDRRFIYINGEVVKIDTEFYRVYNEAEAFYNDKYGDVISVF